MTENYELTLEYETAKEFGWEVMANVRRIKDFNENWVLSNLYKEIVIELHSLPKMNMEKLKEFKVKCRFANKILNKSLGE